MISTVTKSQLIANQLAILITYLPSLMLSDFVFPIVNMPKPLQLLTHLVPARYFIGYSERAVSEKYRNVLSVAKLCDAVLPCLYLPFLNVVKLKKRDCE